MTDTLKERISAAPQKKIGLDGIARTEAEEQRLNSLFLATFGASAGKEVLDYIKAITINTVHGPNVTNEVLRHQEGMRWLALIIESRIEAAKKERGQ